MAQKYPKEVVNNYATMRFNQLTDMCFKKRTYTTVKHAMSVASKWGNRVYQCPQCHKYHTTSKGIK